MAFEVCPHSLFTDYDIYLFKQGNHFTLYEKMGAHVLELDGRRGTYFAVWAPNADFVSVICNLNQWDRRAMPLILRRDTSGIWEGFVPGVDIGEVYKYYIRSVLGTEHEKGDPFALVWEGDDARQMASVVSTTWFQWKDKRWLHGRAKRQGMQQPVSVYELHLGSWRRGPDHPEQMLGYRDIAMPLVTYVKEMGFTHVELMPVMEHPYYPSWGYQITGFFAATRRYGSPQDLMFLINELHKNNIGVILDWVPGHFPGDANGLYRFDGTALYEHADPRQGYHPEWHSYIFNYGRNEVRAFLISNAVFWLDRYHADGLRVDALASILYLDYGREQQGWLPNKLGGRENLDAIRFIQDLNLAVAEKFPDALTIAEDSTDWPGVTHPVKDGGLGFSMKWMMGWMHDTLKYMSLDAFFRSRHHSLINFTMAYAFQERFILPLSHDEVVHGKSSLIYKMWGDEWQRFAGLRTLFLYMFTVTGTKLLFMGDEFGQTSEWNFTRSLDWHLLQYAPHKGLQQWVKKLNELYRGEEALYCWQFEPRGFTWLNADDADHSVFSYVRKGKHSRNDLLIVLNFTPVLWKDYVLLGTEVSAWQILLNSDEKMYFGSDFVPDKTLQFTWNELTGRVEAVTNLPPMGGVVYKRMLKPGEERKVNREKVLAGVSGSVPKSGKVKAKKLLQLTPETANKMKNRK